MVVTIKLKKKIRLLTDATSEAGTTYHSGVPEFTPCF